MSSDPAYRYALYYAPEQSDPLWRVGCEWLGRSPVTGDPEPDLLSQADADRVKLTASARRYGFHATIKAPIALSGSVEDFLADVAALAATVKPFTLPRLRISEEDGFTALRPVVLNDVLLSAGETCVRVLDRHRRPENAERAAVRARDCTERQKALLARWGYPYVCEEWRFHMTLADDILPSPLRAEVETRFAPALAMDRRVTSLCVFQEQSPGAPFTMLARFPLVVQP